MVVDRVDSGRTTAAPGPLQVDTLHEPARWRVPEAQPWRLGRYVVLEQLGRGGMSVVYAAIDPELDRRVAVKLMQDSGARPALRQDFLIREAQALARLSHPNIVAIFDVGVHEGDVFVAMEFVRGQDLRRWLAAAPRTWREIVAVFVQAGQGLAAAHSAGLVHRDVKPDNILVGADGRVRVADFGLVRLDGAAAPDGDDGPNPQTSSLTHTVARPGALLGTPAYMSPEQFDGGSVDALSDQFSFCVALWEALFEVRPFHGESSTELAAAGRRGELPRPSQPHAVPAWLEQTVRRGLSPLPGARWPDMNALLAQLNQGQTRRRRRQLLGVVAALAVLGLAGYGAQRVRQQRAITACVTAGAEISADWDPSIQADLERAFLATGKRHAATSFARTIPWLDRWSESWAAARETTCRAYSVDATWDSELHARAEDCLDDARLEFRALVQALSAANATTLTRATSAAAELAPVDACTRPELLRERPMLDPARRAEVSAIRARLAQASARALTGEFTAGLAIAQASLQAARASESALVEAEAERHTADLQDGAGDYASAEASLLRALAAARAAGSPTEALTNTIKLVWVVGHRQVRHAEAKVWAESAQTQLALLTSEHPLLQARLDSSLGSIHSKAGSYAEATRLHARALEIDRRVLGEEHPNVASALTNLAVAARGAGDHEEAARLYTQALAIAEAAFGPDHPLVASILTNLAVVRDETGAYEEAIRLYTRSLAIRESVLGPTHPALAETLNNIAVVHFTLGAYDEAARLHTRALSIWETALGPNHPLVALALGNLANLELARGAPEAANLLNLRALAIQEAALGPDHPELATTVHNLANGHIALGELAEALRLNQRALASWEAQGPDHPDVAYALQGIGEIHLAAGRPADAVAPLERALKIRSAAASPEELAETRFALARALWDAGLDRRRARTLAEQAQTTWAAATGKATARDAIREWLASHPPA